MLKIENLHVEIDGLEVLKGLDMEVKSGEVHAIMGPNGSGKSTLSKVIAGHPSYKVTEGKVLYEINFESVDLLSLEPDVRAREGIYMAFQYPVEIPGVENFRFLHLAYNSICKHQGVEELGEREFREFVKEKLDRLSIKEAFLNRSVNVGFSGGEKKRNEILQMAVLSPRLSFLDETDSGLDIDALKLVSQGVNHFRNNENAIVLITHYQRLLEYIQPDFVHVLSDGKIVETGDKDLALRLEKEGYDWITSKRFS